MEIRLTSFKEISFGISLKDQSHTGEGKLLPKTSLISIFQKRKRSLVGN